MTIEWTLTAGVGLMVGISIGVLIQMRYIVMMDKKIEHIVEKLTRIEVRTEKEIMETFYKRAGKIKRALKPKRKAAKRR